MVYHIFSLFCFFTITKTYLYNFDPLKPHFYIVKLGFTVVYIIFLISALNIDYGYSLEPPRRGGSNEYPQSMFWAEIWKNIRVFLSENFRFFLVVNVSVYLIRHVFIMLYVFFRYAVFALKSYRFCFHVKCYRFLFPLYYFSCFNSLCCLICDGLVICWVIVMLISEGQYKYAGKQWLVQTEKNQQLVGQMNRVEPS